jgi:hypothetical protein
MNEPLQAKHEIRPCHWKVGEKKNWRVQLWDTEAVEVVGDPQTLNSEAERDAEIAVLQAEFPKAVLIEQEERRPF